MKDVMVWFTSGPKAPPGYSPRIFLIAPYIQKPGQFGGTIGVSGGHQYLKSKCCWGGHDSHHNSPEGEYWGYEIPSERYEECMQYLTTLLGNPTPASLAL